MTDILLESRRGLRQRAFQALMSLEYEGELVEACRFAYSYDKDEEADKAAEADIPAFLLNLVSGVVQSKDDLDKKIAQHLKKGTMSCSLSDILNISRTDTLLTGSHSSLRRNFLTGKIRL